jgi:hypothetical protein
MCAHEQPAIAAWVSDASYPAPERIVMIKPTGERDEWLALLDAKYLQVLRRPRVTQKLLAAYGVKTKQWNELPGLPNERAVRQTIYVRRLHRPPVSCAEKDRTLNLEDVCKQMQEESALVERSFLDLAPLRFLWKPYAIAIVISLIIGMTLSLTNINWMQPVGWVLIGNFTGLSLGLPLLRFRGSRRAVLEMPSTK